MITRFDFANVPAMFNSLYKNSTVQQALVMVEGDAHIEYSGSQLYESIVHISLGLQSIGIQKGDGVGVLSPSNPWWVMMDIALQSIGAILVPLFPNISSENFAFQIENANIQYLYIHNENEVPPAFKNALAPMKSIIAKGPATNSQTISLEAVQALGKQLHKQDANAYDTLISQINPNDIATIVYTSGSTGTPKGVEITHSNLAHQIDGILQRYPIPDAQYKTISVLPLAHIFQRTISFFYITKQCSVYFPDDVKQVAQLAKQIKPQIIVMVPYLLEKIYAGITAKAKQAPLPVRLLLEAAINLAKNNEKATEHFLFPVYQKIFYNKVKQALGGNIQFLVSGGSALHIGINRFFIHCGIPLYQGYGMTEHSPVISANYAHHNMLGSVGPAWPGVSIKISDEHEVLVQSPSVMQGYHKDPEASQSTVINGWLHTGDLGYLKDGYLFLTGRKKELLKTSTGKYVSPAPIELALVQNRLIDAAVIIADDQKYVTALLFVDQEHLKKTLGTLPKEFHNNARSIKIAQRIIHRVNKKLNQWEKIQNFRIIPDIPTVENGMLTPTLKIKRDVILEQYASVIQELYKAC
jgi:long-chain acyl-CoA synthetase